MQEGANWTNQVHSAAMRNGYFLASGGTRLHRQNPVAIRGHDPLAGVQVRFLDGSEAVNDVPARTITRVRYSAQGQPRTHIDSHMNAGVQKGGKPADLPRTRRYIDHARNLEAAIAHEMDEGRCVTVTLDGNWAFTKDDGDDWHWSPEAMFDRLGLVCNYDHPLMPKGGSHGKRGRRIDYIAFQPADFRVTGIEWLEGEDSDHQWPLLRALLAVA